MTQQMHVVACGEYPDYLLDLNKAIIKLYPKATLNCDYRTTFYSIEELIGEQVALLTIGVTAGRTSDGLKQRYDVYFIGTSSDGGCKQLVDKIVTKAGMSVTRNPGEIYLKLQGNHELLQDFVKHQIMEIMERTERQFPEKYL